MQVLPLAANLFAAINAGVKHVTIRRGHLNISPGAMNFVHHGQVGHVQVISVRHTTVGELRPLEYRGDGADSVKQLIHNLKRFYPGLKESDEVTVIFFRKVPHA